MKTTLVLLSVVVLLVAAAPVGADWKPGQFAKYVQLPDLNGADIWNSQNVDLLYSVVADDFPCTSPGPISDLHFWGSWKGDNVGSIALVHAEIMADVPATPGAANFSQPGQTLWERDFTTGTFNVVDYGRGQQSWYDPISGTFTANDHQTIWQVNIPNIVEPFIQDGTAAAPKIFWLQLEVTVDSPATQWGWKTSTTHFQDVGVWASYLQVGNVMSVWHPLTLTAIPANDLAFVITPEPATLTLLALGGMMFLLRRKRG